MSGTEWGTRSRFLKGRTSLIPHGRLERTIHKASNVLKKVNLDPLTLGPEEAIAVLK